MKDLINRSYEAIKKRGLITKNTLKTQFVQKMFDECSEVDDELYDLNPESKYIEEVTDLATVCIMQIHHLGYDFEKEFSNSYIKDHFLFDCVGIAYV